LADIFRDEETLVIFIVLWWVVLATSLGSQLSLLLVGHETHLLMVWGREDIFLLSLTG
jgi:hypothetical protein